jgi:hypothetical protein
MEIRSVVAARIVLANNIFHRLQTGIGVDSSGGKTEPSMDAGI